MRSRTLRRILPAAIVLAVVAAGCGDDKPATNADSSAPASSAAVGSAGPEPVSTTTTVPVAPCVPSSPIAGRAAPTPVAKPAPGSSDVVKTTEIPGTGHAAASGDTVTINYVGWVADGTNVAPFDDSYHTGQMATFEVGGNIIPGFTEGLTGVQAGERRTIVMGSDKAYGAQAPQAQPDFAAIPANAALAFTVDVASVVPGSIDGRSAPAPDVVQPAATKDTLTTTTEIQGDGLPVQAHDTVVGQYVVWLGDGKSNSSIESSWTTGTAAKIPVTDPTTTPGLAQGLIGAKPGERRRIVFGSNLGFGDAGNPPSVPGGATLVYDVDVFGAVPGC